MGKGEHYQQDMGTRGYDIKGLLAGSLVVWAARTA